MCYFDGSCCSVRSLPASSSTTTRTTPAVMCGPWASRPSSWQMETPLWLRCIQWKPSSRSRGESTRGRCHHTAGGCRQGRSGCAFLVEEDNGRLNLVQSNMALEKLAYIENSARMDVCGLCFCGRLQRFQPARDGCVCLMILWELALAARHWPFLISTIM